MSAETCLKLPQNFSQRAEVRSFVMALGAINVEPHEAFYVAIQLMFEFAAQGREWRPLDGFAPLFAEYVGWQRLSGSAGAEMLLAFLCGAGLLVKTDRDGVETLRCPLFNEWNPHLLPDFQTMQQKGNVAARRKKQLEADATMAGEQLKVLQRQQCLNLDELDKDTTENEIEAGLFLILRIDRSGGLAARPTSGYQTWMIAAAVRFRRLIQEPDIDALCDFLLAARIDPTVPKGAELVLPQIDKLLERARQ